jgi:ferredoxin--NADP+ reductase
MGRVIDPDSQTPVIGQYTSGWAKRGPSGVIGTNKPDSVETVKCMLKDMENGVSWKPSSECVEDLIRQRQPEFFSYADWRRLDEIELANGSVSGKPRVKFTSVDDMLFALGR